MPSVEPARELPEHRTLAEVESAFAALTKTDWHHLRGAAWYLLNVFGLRNSAYDPEDLLQEATHRLLTGSRHWRRGLDFEYQIRRIMKSIASNWRRSKEVKPELREAQLPHPEVGTENQDDPVLDPPSPEGSHADGIVAVEQLQLVAKLLEGDAEAFQVIECLELGLTRCEMCVHTKMSDQQLEAAIRRVRRAGEKLRSRR